MLSECATLRVEPVDRKTNPPPHHSSCGPRKHFGGGGRERLCDDCGSRRGDSDRDEGPAASLRGFRGHGGLPGGRGGDGTAAEELDEEALRARQWQSQLAVQAEASSGREALGCCEHVFGLGLPISAEAHLASVLSLATESHARVDTGRAVARSALIVIPDTRNSFHCRCGRARSRRGMRHQ